jgi:hypothetical protein
MDLSKFKPSDWMIVGGGLGFLIFGSFFGWISFSGGGESTSDGNAFDFFLTGTVPWLLIIGAAVVTFLLVAGIIKSSNVPWPLVILAATALGTLLVLLRLLFPTMGEDTDILEDLGIDIGRGIGLWLSTLSAIVATVGAALNFKAQGGSMSDLTNPERLRSSFGGSQGSAPPPPPPPPSTGSAPPPPPPPPAP